MHVRTPEVELDGQQVRFCQKCCKWEPLSAFSGANRSCRKKLDAVRRRRALLRSRGVSVFEPVAPDESAGQQLNAAPAAPYAVDDAIASLCPAVGLDDRLAGDGWGAEPSSRSSDKIIMSDAPALCRAFDDVVAGQPSPDALRMLPMPSVPELQRAAPTRITLSLKVEDAAPCDLPPGLAEDVRRWLTPHFGAPVLVTGTIQPGCILLTVDATVLSPLQLCAGGPGGPFPNAATLAACLLVGADREFWATHSTTVTVRDNAVRLVPGAQLPALASSRPRMIAAPAAPPLPPLRPAAVLSTQRAEVQSTGAVLMSGALRLRLNGQLLAHIAPAAAGSRIRLQLPPTDAHGVALLDWAMENGGCGELRGVLVTTYADVAAEVTATLDDDGGDAVSYGEAEDSRSSLAEASLEREALLFALGAGLRPDAPRSLIAAAAAAAMRRQLHATAARLLAALQAAPNLDDGGEMEAIPGMAAETLLREAAHHTGTAQVIPKAAAAGSEAGYSLAAPGGTRSLDACGRVGQRAEAMAASPSTRVASVVTSSLRLAAGTAITG